MAGDRSAPRDAGRWAFWLVAAGHLAGCLHYFPIQEIVSGEPVLTGDYVQHWLESVHRAEFLREGAIVGWSTRWAAGYVEGLGGLVSNKPYNLVVAVLPEAFRPLGFNLTVLVALWLFPPLVYLAARRFGHSRPRAALAMGLAAACWYGSMLFRVFWRAGSPTFLVGTAAAAWAAGLLYSRWGASEGRRPSLSTLALVVALVPWIHSGAIIVLAIFGFSVWVATLRDRGLRLTELASIGAIAAIANLPWIWPLVQHRDLQRSLYYGIYPGGPEFLLYDFVRGPLHLGTGAREEAAILGWIFLLALPGAAKLRDRSVVVPALALSGGAFAILAYGGDALGRGIGSLQPYRFVIPLAVVFAIAAAGFPSWRSSRRATVRAAALVVALVVAAGIADRLRIARRAGDYVGAGLGETESWALATLREAASPHGERVGGRVLAEGDWWVEPVPGRPAARRVTYSFVGLEGKIDAEFIGAPTMPVLTPAEDASFWVGKLFGRRIETWDAEAFRRLCDAYGIRWVVTLRPASTRSVASFAPLVERLAERGGAAVFRVALPLPATVRSDGRRIEVEATRPGTIILPYHWNPLLTVRPDAELRPVPSGILPQLSFVEITAPAPGRYTVGVE